MQQAARRKAKAAGAANPKPKGSGKKPRQAPKRHEKADAVAALVEQGKSIAEIAAETGVPARQARHIAEEEAIRREAEAQIDPATLSLSAQQKLGAAIRQHQRKLDHEFEARVLAGIQERLEATVLPHYKKTEAQYRVIIKSRKGVMDRATYKKILSCLHPDRVDPSLARRYEEAFNLFTKLEAVLLKEKESPTPSVKMPTTYAEMMAMKQTASDARKAKRNGSVRVA
jgi:transposase-like protein